MEPMLIPWMMTRKRPQNSITELQPQIPLNKRAKLSSSAAKKKEKPKFRLVSFCPRDLSETSRMILAYAGIEFEDYTLLDFKEQIEMEYDTYSNGFPILVWNGKNIYGNDAITRMLAKMYGLAGNGIFEEAQVDTIIGIERDVANAVINYVKGYHGWRKGMNLKKIYSEEFEPRVKKYFGILEKSASKTSVRENGFFFSTGVTYADFVVTNMYELLHSVGPKLMESFQNVTLIVQRVNAIPQLQSYLKNRISSEEIIKIAVKIKAKDKIIDQYTIKN